MMDKNVEAGLTEERQHSLRYKGDCNCHFRHQALSSDILVDDGAEMIVSSSPRTVKADSRDEAVELGPSS